MNPFGAPVKRFFQSRGFSYRGEFRKFLQDRSLLVSVAFEPVKAAFGGREVLGYSIALQVFYPLQTHFFLVSPDELRNFRRDGTLRHMCYVNESSAVFQRSEGLVVHQLLSDHFDSWYEKVTEPRLALAALAAFRNRNPFPPFLAYLEEFVAESEEQKLEFGRDQVSAIWPFDGGINFYAFVAYLNAAGRFAEATALIEQALESDYFANVRHARVTLDVTLKKLLQDARESKISLSEMNLAHLESLGVRGGAI